MNWLQSGIKHTLEFEQLDPLLKEHRGYLTVYDASIDEGYYTDSKARADITCLADTWIPNSAVRIWDTLSKGDESEKVCLGTFIQDSYDEETTDNRRTITLSMMHPIDKLTTDLRCGDIGVAAGTSVADWCKQTCENAYIDIDIADGVTGTFSSAWVWEHGESVLEGLNRATGSTYQVGADVYGRVTIRPYVTPSLREPSYTLTAEHITDSASISIGDVCNRVVVLAEQDDQQLCASAQVDPSHPWSINHIGRWYTKEYTESKLDEFTQAAVQALANTYMKENDGTTRKWEIKCLLFPCSCGETLRLQYGGEDVVCLIQQRKLNLVNRTMELILNEVA